MLTLPEACALFNNTRVLEGTFNIYSEYLLRKYEASKNEEYNEKKFDEAYAKALNAPSDFFLHLKKSLEDNFSECSKGLFLYNAANISSCLKNYASSQKGIKKCISFLDAEIKPFLETPNRLKIAEEKIKEVKEGSKKAAENYIKIFGKNYDSLSVNDFKAKGVSYETAFQRYTLHMASTFQASSQKEEETEKAKKALKKSARKIKSKVANSEQKKLKFNVKTSSGLYYSNYSNSEVDSILGSDYFNKSRWKENLSPIISKGIESLIATKQ